MLKGSSLLLASLVSAIPALGQTRSVQPVLAFPEAGVDDPAAYQGYQTRFFRDSRGNVVQIYLDARSGRVVTLLANAVDESAGFTVRDAAGAPVRLEWGAGDATISDSAGHRTIQYQLVADAPQIVVGWILLGSMRVERDLGYSGRGLEQYAWPTFTLGEQEEMIGNIDHLDPLERDRELGMLGARFVSDLRGRLTPDILTTGMRGPRGVSVTQPSFDGKTNLRLDFGLNPQDGALVVSVPTITISANGSRPIRFTVRVTTDAPALTPLSRDQIFNSSFLQFLANARTTADRARARGAKTAADVAIVSRYRQLERDVRGTELLSSREKLMAGMPNYATYFGRDMMMTSLMMQPVWQDVMSEHVIASALRKLGPLGDVSHEEALGGQAIRENAAEYNAHIAEYARLTRRNSRAADTALANARALLVNLQRVRENYHMRDDEFQLPVLAARYLTNPAVTNARKKAFLMDSAQGRPQINLLLRELALVAELAEPYSRNPIVENLVASPRLDSAHWRSISWRDSNAGYANGRFAMDINAIWVPKALESIAQILDALRALGFGSMLASPVTNRIGGSALVEFARNPAALQREIETWRGAVKHFAVSLAADEVRSKVQQKLQWLPSVERSFWQRVLTQTGTDRLPLEFTALSLDSAGKPIAVVNTDPSTWLLLRDASDTNPAALDRVRRDVRATLRPYPVGLLISGLGPVVANDAYAPPSVWEAFKTDTYHSPRVVWGREVNLLLLGIANQISGATDAAGRPRDASLAPYVTEMRDALRRANDAVEASGLKHNELWSYQILGGELKPIRYGASTDVQLWNVTDLAVQFVLAGLGAR